MYICGCGYYNYHFLFRGQSVEVRKELAIFGNDNIKEIIALLMKLALLVKLALR